MGITKMGNKKRIEYIPPKEAAVHDFARDVCKAMNDDKPDTVYGLAGFLKVVLRAVANNLNKNSDNDSIGGNHG
jgi:hypothetical protein